jgi:hypothetical protein
MRFFRAHFEPKIGLRPPARIIQRPALFQLRLSAALLMLSLAPPSLLAETQRNWKWSIETVDSAATFTSLAVDAEGNVHVAYASGSGGYDLKYAFRPAGSSKWFNMLLEKEYSTFATNIAVDAGENPHI